MYVFLLRLLIAMITAIDLFMMLRAILSFLPFAEDTAVERFAIFITEPFIMPVRAIVMRIEFFRTLPIDMSFFFTFILLSIVNTFLSSMV